MRKCAICKESDQPRHGKNRILHEAFVRINDRMSYPQAPLSTASLERGFQMFVPVTHI